jgi:hypothetical protein
MQQTALSDIYTDSSSVTFFLYDYKDASMLRRFFSYYPPYKGLFYPGVDRPGGNDLSAEQLARKEACATCPVQCLLPDTK